MDADKNFALKIAAKPLQRATWLLLTAYKNSSSPYPIIPSPNSYNIPFSHNPYVTDKHTDGRTTACAIGTTLSTALHLAIWPQIFSACHTSTHVDDCALRLRYRWSLHALCVLLLATAPFQRLMHRSGTVC